MLLYLHTLAFLTVVLESAAAAPTFRGFLIQARLVADDSTVVGQFEGLPVGGEYRYGSCANTEVEENSSVILTKIANKYCNNSNIFTGHRISLMPWPAYVFFSAKGFITAGFSDTLYQE